MTTLLQDPYWLEEGDLIVATIEALNEIGYSEPSAENTQGAVIQVPPHNPTIAPSRGASSSAD
jgi:hypothetical protein